METTHRRLKHMPHNYITGLGSGVTGAERTANKPGNVRDATGNNVNVNNNNNSKDDEYVSYLRKAARDRSYPYANHDNRVPLEPQAVVPPAKSNWRAPTVGDSYYYTLSDSPTLIGPWQIAAFALLGAVILLSALFLHMLADGAPEDSHHGSYHQGHASQKNRRTSTRKRLKKKTDEWSDDATDAEEELLSASVRGQGAYYRTESSELYNESSHYYDYAPYGVQQQHRHRKNSATTNNNSTHGQPHRNYYQASGNAYRCPTPSSRVTAVSPSMHHRSTVTALAGPPLPTTPRFPDASENPLVAEESQRGGTSGVRVLSGASSLESLTPTGSNHHRQPQQHGFLMPPPPPPPLPGQQRSPGLLRSGGRKSMTAVTIQEPIREERTPEHPRDLVLPPPSAPTIDKTPKVRNGKTINAPGAVLARDLHASYSPSAGRMLEVDEGIVMPFLPILTSSSHHSVSHHNEAESVDGDGDDLRLYHMMESGNVTYWKRTLSSPQRANGGGAEDAFTPQRSRDEPPPSYRGGSEHFLEMSESVDDVSGESLDSNDPRKNIQHKRADLTVFTDSSASLQGAIDFSELQLTEVIGGGGFGQVWKAMWRGTPVAVKVLTGSAQAKHVPRAILEEFCAEINLLKGMRHPNICLYMGASLAPPNRAIITELAANGSLWDALRLPLAPPYAPCDGVSRLAWPMSLYQPDPRHGVPPSMNSGTVPSVPPKGTWPCVLVKKVACGSARGMAYLHSGSPPVLHRDLKSANILLDESYTPKVCDFGLSRLKAQDRSMTGNCGTVQWMAPEVLSNTNYNEKADVYSYGIILWELLARQCPYEDMSAIQCALAVLNRNHRPEIPRWCPPPLQVLIRSCLKKDPDERPTFPEILQTLDDMP